MRFRAVALALLLAALSTTSATATPARDVAPTDKGLVKGVSSDGVLRFQGIPFAAPPLGSQRWQPPRPARPWHGVLDASAPKSQCAQTAPAYGGETTYVEDCLYLNVTTTSLRGNRPVMVWVHGGSNLTGSGAPYNGAKLATMGDVVVVTINYRLGVIGWLGEGNYGLLDQQAALRWVGRNARAFGGDPRNITLFGESAGAANTCAQLASPAARGLFHRAIPQSYSCTSPVRTPAGAATEQTRLMSAVGCADLACLRATPVRTLMEQYTAIGGQPGPVAGTSLLPRPPAEAIASGHFNRVPVMHGNTRDEMRLFVGLTYPTGLTAEQYTAYVRANYPRSDAVLAKYPPGEDPRVALSAIQTDYGTPLATCGHLAADALFRKAGVPIYAYQFADREAPPLIDLPGFDEGAEHATELTYLWPGLLGELTEPQTRLSDTMVRYWTSFAHTGRPWARHAPTWPKFRSPTDVLNLAPGAVHPYDAAARANCTFWTG